MLFFVLSVFFVVKKRGIPLTLKAICYQIVDIEQYRQKRSAAAAVTARIMCKQGL